MKTELTATNEPDEFGPFMPLYSGGDTARCPLCCGFGAVVRFRKSDGWEETFNPCPECGKTSSEWAKEKRLAQRAQAP